MGILTNIRSGGSPSNPSVDWQSMFGLRSAKSGSTVNEQNVMGLPAVWCGVNFISTTIASLPLHVHQRTNTGSEVATNHPLDRVLSIHPNEHQDPFKFIETCQNSELLTGHVWLERITNGRGGLAGLSHIPTWAISKAHGEKDIYRVSLKDGKSAFLHKDQVAHIEGPYGGRSIIHLMIETFGLSLSIDEFASNFFGQGANPGIVIRHPQSLTPDGQKKLQNALRGKYEGLGSSFRLMLLDEGMEAQKIMHSLEENQLVGLKQFQISDVARILNLPPHILKDLSKSSFNNIEKQSIELVIYSLMPRVKRYESVFNRFLLTGNDSGKYFVKFNMKGLLRGDDQARSEFYTKMRRLGVFSVNEIRGLEDMNSIGPIGDQYHVSADLMPLESVGKEPEVNQKALFQAISEFKNREIEDKTERSEADLNKILKIREQKMQEYEPLFESAIQGVVNREVAVIKKALKADDFEAKMREFYDGLPDIIRQKCGVTFTAYSNSVKALILDEIGEETAHADFDTDFDEYLDGFIRRYIDAAIGQIILLMNDSEDETYQDTVFERMDDWYETKAEKESERQAVSVMGFVASSVILGAGLKLIWKNTGGDSCPYCKKMHNKIVSKKGQTFAKEGETLEGNDEKPEMTVKYNTKYPQLHRGCRCVVVSG